VEGDGWLWLQLGLAAIVALIFGVVFEGAPYVPTKRKEIEAALKLAKLKEGELIVDLGSGDGRLLAAAADKGYRALGYELSPILAFISKLTLRKYGDAVQVRTANFWYTKLPDDTKVVFVFLAGPFMKRLSRHMQREANRLGRPVSLISYGFDLPNYKPSGRKGALKLYEITPVKEPAS
jgi:SAM-dependent methyltransferase